MAEEYQNTFEQYNFNNILLNVVRGSEGLPVSLLDIPNIIGTGLLCQSQLFMGPTKHYVGII